MEEVILTTLYAKKGAPDCTHKMFEEEWNNDAELIKSGNHPWIGYVDRRKPGWKITDAWWME